MLALETPAMSPATPCRPSVIGPLTNALMILSEGNKTAVATHGSSANLFKVPLAPNICATFTPSQRR